MTKLTLCYPFVRAGHIMYELTLYCHVITSRAEALKLSIHMYTEQYLYDFGSMDVHTSSGLGSVVVSLFLFFSRRYLAA